MRLDLRKIRDFVKLLFSITCFFIYLPHIFYFIFGKDTNLIEDVGVYKRHLNLTFHLNLCFLFLVHTNPYFRTLLYHRMGPVLSSLISWWRPGDKYFVISKTTKIGAGAYFVHSFASEINAEYIGSNFSCRHLTTLGNKKDGDNNSRPIIGDNVTLGVNVTIIGNVKIGNNVIIGAGSVVVKDIPDNSIAVGNPARIINKII